MQTQEVEELVNIIAQESGLSREEVLSKMEEKIAELGGLIGKIGAAHLIARELGVELNITPSRKPELKIADVFPGMNSIDIVGRVLEKLGVREFKKSDGSTGRVASLILGDDTGRIRVVFWNGDVERYDEIEEGDVLKLKGAYSKANLNGDAEIHIGIRTRVILNPPGVDADSFPEVTRRKLKLGELSQGMQSIDVVCKVLRVYEPREFERVDGTLGRVVNLLVSDDSAIARLVLWDENVGMVDRIKEGDILEVSRGYVRERNGMIEVNVGRYGSVKINPPGVTLENALELTNQAVRKPLKEAQEGETVQVRGAIVDIAEPKVFSRDSGEGVVVNAVIDDSTMAMRCAFYDGLVEALLNQPLEALIEGEVDLSSREEELLGREVIVTGRIRKNDFTQRLEMVVEDIDLNPDPKEEAKRLLAEIKEMNENGA